MKTFEEIKKFNPYHGSDGRFTTGAAATSFTTRTKNPAKQSLADKAVEREKERTNKAKKGLNSCKSVEEVGNYLKKNYSINSVTDHSASYGNTCDVKTFRSIAQGITTVMDEFPEMKGVLDSISINYLRQGVAATGSDGQKIVLHELYCSRPDIIERNVKSDSVSGFHPKNTGVESIGYHEAGHVLEAAIYNLKPCNHLVNGWLQGGVSNDITLKAFDNMQKNGKADGKTFKELKKEVSGYAASDFFNLELFAEAISDCCTNGKNAHPFSQEIKKVARETIDSYKETRRQKERESDDEFARWLKDNPSWGTAEDAIARGVLSRDGAIRNGLISKSKRKGVNRAMLTYDDVSGFIDYIEYYPGPDEPGFDGVHYGGFKGLKPGAPDSAVEAYAKYVAMQKEAEEHGIKL